VRLTDSGLSITEWEPIVGILPPLSQQAWQEAFAAYRAIPQYEALFPSMRLAEFKVIYWWEWAHRFVGRLVGFVFLLPLVVFWQRGWLNRVQLGQLGFVFALGALQAFVGWVMVQSGLSERVSVAPMRLAFHFGLAMIIIGSILLIALGYRRSIKVSPFAGFVAACVFGQLLLGAMVAGSDGGMIHQHWLWPQQADLAPSLANPVFWHATHRLSAALVWLVALAYLCFARRLEAGLLVGFLSLQIVMGIFTLASGVFLPIALLHQLGGIVCWAFALLLLTSPKESV